MESAENREMRTTQVFKAPLDLMWEVWTKPEHIANWWGPSGFTSTIHEMDMQEGGEWKLTLHGPDGKNYPNRSIFREIVLFEKIAFEHFNPHFFTMVLFGAKDAETLIDWALLFDTPEMYDIIVKTHQADEGQRQNLEKLGKYLEKLLGEADGR